MISGLLKKTSGLGRVLMVFLGLQFFLLPLYHYHPQVTHSHAGEGSLHTHGGYFHSAGLENLIKKVHLVPLYFGFDEDLSHNHPGGREDGDAENILDTLKVVSGKDKPVLSPPGMPSILSFSDPEPRLAKRLPIEAPAYSPLFFPGGPLERGPPSLSI